MATRARLRLSAFLVIATLVGWDGLPVAAQPSVEECSRPMLEVVGDGSSHTDEIEFLSAVDIAELEATLEITTETTSLWFNISLESPAGTVVQLQRSQAGGSDFDLTYTDLGLPNDGTDLFSGLGEPSVYDCLGCRWTPAGSVPGATGAMSDFDEETTLGDWLLTLHTFAAGTVDEWCVTAYEVKPVESLSCTPIDTGFVNISLTATQDYDELRFYRNGELIEAITEGYLEGEFIEFENDESFPTPSVVSLEVTGAVDGVEGPPARCSIALPSTPSIDFEATPDQELSVTAPPYVGIFTTETDIEIADVQVDVEITSIFVDDLSVEIASSSETAVTLHESVGGVANMNLTFWENGVPYGSELTSFDCGCFMRPSGPGQLRDFFGESSVDTDTGIGVWALYVSYSGFLTSLVERVAVRIYEDAPVFRVADLECVRTAGFDTVEVTWRNVIDYDEVEILLDGVVVATITEDLVGGELTTWESPAQSVPQRLVVGVRGLVDGESSPVENCAAELFVDPIEELSCARDLENELIDIDWVNPIVYDAINIYVDGVLEASLDGTSTEYNLEDDGAVSGTVDIAVEGVVTAVASAAQAECRVLFLEPADAEVCDTPLLEVGIDVPIATIDVVDSLNIEEVETVVDITTPFIGSWRIDLRSPASTEVRLHNFDTLLSQDMFLVYSDSGVDHDPPYDCGCAMQPQAEGGMSRFMFENSEGEWQLEMFTVNGVTGTLNAWCVRIFGCSTLPPTDFECVSSFDRVVLTWENQDNYDEVRVYQDDVLLATLDGDEETYTVDNLDVGRYAFRLVARVDEFECDTTSEECDAPVGFSQYCDQDVPIALDDSISVNVPDSKVVADIEVLIDFTYGFGPETMDLNSPAATELRLHDTGFTRDGIQVVYTDDGIANEEPFDCDFCRMLPAGPGAFADYELEDAEGDWVLDVFGAFSQPIMYEWCVFVFEPRVEGQFLRGDGDGNGVVFCLVDAIYILQWGFVNGPEPPCLDAADIDDSGVLIPLLEAIYCLNYTFNMGPVPPDPGPDDCGEDPTDDMVDCEFGSEGCA